LELVPRGWRTGEIGDVLTLRNERTKPSSQTAALPYVPIESISAKMPFLQEYKSGEDANSSLVIFREGDVLFGAMRPYFHKVCIAPFDGVTRTTVFTLASKNSLSVGYALFLLYQDSTVEYATQHSEGSTIPYSKWNNSLERMPIVLPPEPVRICFSNAVSGIIERANANIQQAQTLATLRDTLLPRLISGQLRLPEAESQIEAAMI
jgi:type I restriction enzyme S subunit